MDNKLDRLREAAEGDLETFIKLIHPNRMLAHCHKELIQWMTRQEAKSHQLIIFPRDHMKSALAAYRAAWEITKNPSVRIVYTSATSTLAEKQLGFIKDILTSKKYRQFWPEMVNEDEGKRKKWTEREIMVDHPQRVLDSIRDATVFAAGLTTTITGLHCDISILDDVVVEDNAYTNDGRKKVADQVSYLTSIAGTEGKQWVFGTRYHPKDQYYQFMEQVVEIYDDDHQIEDSYGLYEKYERVVEEDSQFLWPKLPGSKYGFDKYILAKKKAGYTDYTKFRAQYYNDPNDAESSPIKTDSFQYYKKENLHHELGRWYIRDRRLNIYAAIDFAYSTKAKADFTSIVVVGVDSLSNYYVLDIRRFKTDKIQDYYNAILELHIKWNFRKIRAEITAAQSMIVKELKDNYIRAHGLGLSIDEQRPTKNKEERIRAILQPKYENKQIYHFSGGLAELLEDELVKQNPAHDDIKDALASCIEICIPPMNSHTYANTESTRQYYNSKFGGIN